MSQLHRPAGSTASRLVACRQNSRRTEDMMHLLTAPLHLQVSKKHSLSRPCSRLLVKVSCAKARATLLSIHPFKLRQDHLEEYCTFAEKDILSGTLKPSQLSLKAGALQWLMRLGPWNSKCRASVWFATTSLPFRLKHSLKAGMVYKGFA